MRQRITNAILDGVPALIEQGMTKQQIAERFDITVGSLTVMCSRRGISLRHGGPLVRRTTLSLPEEPLPLSEDILKSLRKTARQTGRPNTASLITDLLERIVSDNLFTAVLDEEII